MNILAPITHKLRTTCAQTARLPPASQGPRCTRCDGRTLRNAAAGTDNARVEGQPGALRATVLQKPIRALARAPRSNTVDVTGAAC
jgi:hypothetical protein